MTIEVTVKMTTWMTYEVDETDPYRAVRTAIISASEGDQPDEYPLMPDFEVSEVKVGDRVIYLSYHLDLYGPKDEYGMCRHEVIAREGADVVARGFSMTDVITAAVAAGGDE